MERLEGAQEEFLDRIASIQTSRQPYVVKYVVDSLMEEDEGEEAVALTDDQKGFLLLKTVIDVLDQKGINGVFSKKWSHLEFQLGMVLTPITRSQNEIFWQSQ